MPRTKKSRKPGPLGTPKQSVSRSQSDSKKKKVSKGRASGSRNSLIEQDSLEPKPFSGSKDKRLGSKKKISLFSENKKEAQQPKPLLPKFKSPSEELDYIENDRRLQSLLDKIDTGGSVSAEEQHYVDTLLARHKLLCDLLGIDTEEAKAEEEKPQTNEAIDLLDQLEQDYKF